ncbi:MAG: translocation/assembly module TamB domain-containing protein [Rhodobacteraceae bacterium]|nr:translocation/assembly module TamB domain-containing protein [Paracoccaceae bacterium]
MNRLFTYILAGTLVAAPLVAQDQDSQEAGGFLVGFIEDSLSGDNRQISVIGMQGALSSQATIRQITVSDDDGIWLTIDNAVLDWNRLALIQGRFSVNALTAETVRIERRPTATPPDPELPIPEATPFQLPELPVAVELGEIRVGRIELGKDLLGTAASLSLNGALQLSAGALDLDLSVARLDKPGDLLRLDASFVNETSVITLDLALEEAANGLVTSLLDLPGRPTVRLSVMGTGPVNDFNANLELDTNGTRRLGGQLVLAALPSGDSETPNNLSFTADLSGDIDPLLPPPYRPFFGAGLRANLQGHSDPDGRLTLDNLVLRSRALQLTGALALAPGGVFESANIKAAITPPKGQAAVLLPIAGGATTLAGIELTAQKTAAGDWQVKALLDRLSHPGLSLSRADLTAVGTLDQSDGFAISGYIEAALSGLKPADPGLAQALGDQVSFAGTLATQGDLGLTIRNMALRGSDYHASGEARIEGLDSGLKITTDLHLEAADLARFSGLAGHPLGGAVTAELNGFAAPLSGSFDLGLAVRADQLTTGLAQIDPLISGITSLTLQAARGTDGLRIDQFELSNPALSAQAQGRLDSNTGSLTLTARLNDTGPLLPQTSGPLELSADVTRDGDTLSGTAQLLGPNASQAVLEGSIDRSGTAELTFDATLMDLQRFLPELAGQLAAQGSASRRDGLWRIDSNVTGPAGIDASITGSWNETLASADLRANGQLRLDAANLFIKPNSVRGLAKFDMTLKGPPALSSLSGSISTSGTTLAIPAAKQQIEAISATISVAQSSAHIQISAQPRAGGAIRISGPVSLTAPFDGNIQLALDSVVLTDNLIYNTVLTGALGYSGPLAGNGRLAGHINVGETNINLAAAGGSVTSAPIPPIRHLNEPAASRSTRARAGLINQAPAGSGPDIALDILINAPGHIFARGRGLQAELGGQIHVRGSTANLAPSGQIDLIRGHFNLLGRKLELDEGRVTLQGNLVPYLDFKSTANTSEGSATLEISGLIDAPVIKVHSDPARPSEEALALLLFGENIEDLSPLALARMAGSLRELSGRGGNTEGALRDGTGADEAALSLDGLGLGGYVADNVYTDFNVNTRGDSELNINLDISSNVTVTGTVESDGDTGVGLFFKKDY